eukprot:scaffold1525_cov142-Cylindrotheca_fusiformis.AAC.64
MGGDDLGSDDEYLTAPVRAESSSVDEEDVEVIAKQTKATKREIGEEKTELEAAPSKKRRKRDEGLGESTCHKSTEEQAKRLTSYAGVDFYPNQMAISENRDSPSLTKRIQGIVSKKKLKKHNKKMSPLVIVISISARRAVSVLKELSPFNVRVAKLFPKQGSIEEQASLLQSTCMPIAVCTPHRLLALVEEESISLSDTQLIVIDTHQDAKKFSVDTLPDTAPHLLNWALLVRGLWCSMRGIPDVSDLGDTDRLGYQFTCSQRETDEQFVRADPFVEFSRLRSLSFSLPARRSLKPVNKMIVGDRVACCCGIFHH